MRIALQHSEEIAFVQTEAVAVLENADIPGGSYPVNDVILDRADAPAITQLPTQSRLVVDQDHAFAALCGRQGSLHSRPSAANHGSIGMHPGVFVVGGSRRKNLTQTGDFANHRLGSVPQRRMGQRFVIPAYWHQPVQTLSNGKEVSI